MTIYDLLNKRTIKPKKENIEFISKQIGVNGIEAQKVYKKWKIYYMSTFIDEHSSYHTGAKSRKQAMENKGKKVVLI
jgi:hypothetical protein